jgi:hypothetical protein
MGRLGCLDPAGLLGVDQASRYPPAEQIVNG